MLKLCLAFNRFNFVLEVNPYIDNLVKLNRIGL